MTTAYQQKLLATDKMQRQMIAKLRAKIVQQEALIASLNAAIAALRARYERKARPEPQEEEDE